MSHELPTGWAPTTVSDVVIYNPKTQALDDLQCGFVPMHGLGIRYGSTLKIEAKPWGDVRKSYTHFKEGDVLVAKVTPCFENGKAGVARNLPNGIGAGSSEFSVFRPMPGIDPRYLLAKFSTDEFRRRAAVEMTGSVGLKRVPKDVFLAEPLPLAPFAEQQRIADKLDTVLTRVDACRDRLARVGPLLKRFRQSVLAAATSGRLTEDWPARLATGVGPEELIAARLRAATTSREKNFVNDLCSKHPPTRRADLPSNWLSTCIGLSGSVSNGSTPSRSTDSYWQGEIPWVSSGEVRNSMICATRERITLEGFNSASVKLLPAGTVLVAMIGEGKTRGQTGLLCIEACINQNIAGVVPDAGILDSRYLWYWFQGQYEATRQQGNGTGPQALNCQRVRELPLNLPPLEEQAEIVRRVDTIFAFADRLEARLAKAQAAADRLTPALLAKAFRGELVPQDPDDEPAAELLKRLAESKAAASAAKPKSAKTHPAAAAPGASGSGRGSGRPRSTKAPATDAAG